MFKRREIRIKLSKIDPDAQTSTNDSSFEEKAEMIFRQIESIGVKVFAGVCIYVLLDTYRKIEVAKITVSTYQ